MKKSLTILVLLFALFASNDCLAQSNRQRKKEAKKEYSKRKKELTREGYQLAGSSRSLEMALIKHFDKLNADESNKEMVVTVENCPTEHLCQSKALTNAITLYATKTNNFVKGRINSAEGFDAATEVDKTAIDRFFGGFEILVKQNCSHIFSNSSFSVIKKTETGYKYKVFYIYNEKDAEKLRTDAARAALEKVEMNIEWSDKIHEFVREGFEGEK